MLTGPMRSPLTPPSGPTDPSLAAISAYLLDLHRASHELPLRALQTRCLEGLRAVVPFDSALVATGTLQHGVPHAHDAYLYGQSPALMESWERVKHLDLVAQAALANPGRALRFVSAEVFADLPAMLAHCRAFSLEHVVCTTEIAERAGGFFALSVYRHDPDEPFRDEERATIGLLVPHMLEAMRRARIEQVRRAARVNRRANEAAAIVGRAGVVLEAEPAFVELLSQVHPEWTGPWLPPPLAWLATVTSGGRHAIGRLVLRADPSDDLVLLHARRAHAIDGLTEREREVAGLVASGDSAKEIAARLSIAANTVRVHVGRIYEKLGVVNKAELASMMADHEG